MRRRLRTLGRVAGLAGLCAVGYVVAAVASGANLSTIAGTNGNGKKPTNGTVTAPHPGTPGVQKIAICHRTGSASNPYVLIMVDDSALNGHLRHPPKGGRNDIIPAPVGADKKPFCPGGVTTTTTPTTTGHTTTGTTTTVHTTTHGTTTTHTTTTAPTTTTHTTTTTHH
jgi:hypothetical protein